MGAPERERPLCPAFFHMAHHRFLPGDVCTGTGSRELPLYKVTYPGNHCGMTTFCIVIQGPVWWSEDLDQKLVVISEGHMRHKEGDKDIDALYVVLTEFGVFLTWPGSLAHAWPR